MSRYYPCPLHRSREPTMRPVMGAACRKRRVVSEPRFQRQVARTRVSCTGDCVTSVDHNGPQTLWQWKNSHRSPRRDRAFNVGYPAIGTLMTLDCVTAEHEQTFLQRGDGERQRERRQVLITYLQRRRAVSVHHSVTSLAPRWQRDIRSQATQSGATS